MFCSLSFHATTNEMKEIATNNWNLETRSLTCPTIYSIVLNKKKNQPCGIYKEHAHFRRNLWISLFLSPARGFLPLFSQREIAVISWHRAHAYLRNLSRKFMTILGRLSPYERSFPAARTETDRAQIQLIETTFASKRWWKTKNVEKIFSWGLMVKWKDEKELWNNSLKVRCSDIIWLRSCSVENLGKTFKREKSYDKLIYHYDVKSICAFLSQLNCSIRGLAKET